MSGVTVEESVGEFRGWLDEHWSTERTVGEWWSLMASAGWQFPHWPEGLGGRGLPIAHVRRLAEQLVDVGALGPPSGLGVLMGAPVVMQLGSAEQQQRFVPPLADGTEAWCQFFSEPEAGSDLAGLRTRAERDGDEWVVTGQKVWTSGAKVAQRGMLVARTNWDAPKHKGLSYFIIELDQPGIEVRPLRQMNGAAHFNEVFFTEARVSDADRIGGEGEGWAATVATLAFERAGLSARVPGLRSVEAGPAAGNLDRPCGEVLAPSNEDRQQVTAAVATGNAIRDLATDNGAALDPVMRDDLVRATVLSRTQRWNVARARAEMKAGGQPGVEANLAKLNGSHLGRASQSLGPRVVGAHGMLSGDDGALDGSITDMVLSVPAQSIAGGSDEVQRNIISERGLGLPKDVQVDRDVPFRDVQSSGST